MEARLVSPTEDVNIDELNEEELEAYVKQLEEARDKALVKVKDTQDKMDKTDRAVEHLDKVIEENAAKIKAREERIAVIDVRMKERDDEYKRAIHETLKPLYTGEITHFDLSKVSDDPWFQKTIRRGNQQKAPTSGSEQHTPPSPERHPVSSGGSSTPPSKASRSDDLSRQSSSLSLSSRSDSDSGDEKQRSKDSPQSTKPTLSSQI